MTRKAREALEDVMRQKRDKDYAKLRVPTYRRVVGGVTVEYRGMKPIPQIGEAAGVV